MRIMLYRLRYIIFFIFLCKSLVVRNINVAIIKFTMYFWHINWLLSNKSLETHRTKVYFPNNIGTLNMWLFDVDCVMFFGDTCRSYFSSVTINYYIWYIILLPRVSMNIITILVLYDTSSRICNKRNIAQNKIGFTNNYL